ncbi:uncharacterized protein BBA_09615 [Beauveria bassiana ARSEF 2860]|uniref:Uncharacterized protein n=1 Tax=Beauveria bassiana (strain ARSEF 2860) TaxID=655819 RepID=J4VS36_BEAB2|nr:uncharacterized protein BBA_09615 [Beauveria bassiana ARSEF 2860]EJP61425.1 hypothetical protein BBA_09615 [Beauveria bassiana ARSEF 2860]
MPDEQGQRIERNCGLIWNIGDYDLDVETNDWVNYVASVKRDYRNNRNGCRGMAAGVPSLDADHTPEDTSFTNISFTDAFCTATSFSGYFTGLDRPIRAQEFIKVTLLESLSQQPPSSVPPARLSVPLACLWRVFKRTSSASS